MTAPDIRAVLRIAAEQHLLPARAAVPPLEAARPWPVVLLTALGAWLAALPILGGVGLLLGELLLRGAGLYVVGALMLLGALVVLRAYAVPLFVEQVAVPALLVGALLLGYGLMRDLGQHAGAAALVLLALAVGVVVRGTWLRVLLGAGAAVLFVPAIGPAGWFDRWGTGQLAWWWPLHLALLAWLLAQAALRAAASTRAAAAVQSLATGWLLATLAALAWWSGMTFLVAASAGTAGAIARELSTPGTHTGGIEPAISVVLALAGAAWAAREWPGLRRPWLAAVALVLAGICWFMPTLGAVWLALAVCCTASRWTLAGAAALAAAWIVGAFYYGLAWPLGTKALVLAAAGAALGALAWQALAVRATPRPAHTASPTRFTRWGIAASVVLVLASANVGIWQKERLIREGQPVFVELAPVDPRSLMQGDYMRLNFRLPPGLERISLVGAKRPHVIARRDARGVAALLRIDGGGALAAGEMRIELSPKGGGWILVSDAWFFAEGEAQRWARARYGEFRVEPGGRALLVGLRGPGLEAL